MIPFELPDSNQLADIAATYQLRLIVLFGSAVRGVIHAESDVDLTEKFRDDLRKYVAERAEEMRYVLAE